MPHFRKLWKKITTSEDIQAMPDDTMRLAWTWLPTVLDREGRGIWSGAWLRANVFPLREDVTNGQCLAMLEWWKDHKMIVAYCIDGREYFTIPTWFTYQGHCAKEAVSEIPPPPTELVTTSARPTLDLILTESGTSALASASVSASVSESVQASSIPPGDATAAAISNDDAKECTRILVEDLGADLKGAIAALKPGLSSLSSVRGWADYVLGDWESIRQRCDPVALVLARVKAGVSPPKSRASPDNGDSDRRRFISGEYAEYIKH